VKVLVCKCHQCRYVRRSGATGYKAEIKAKRHGLRTLVRVRLAAGEYDNLPEVIPAGYPA